MKTWKLGRTDRYPPGPWHDEPDKMQWIDEATDLDCLMVRGPVGAWCGYVGLPPGHPLHAQSYWDVNVGVHGDLTYADFCQEDEPDGICHIPGPGRPANVWWFGFDCAHGGDLTPDPMMGMMPGVYRDMAYVQGEVTSLARQLAMVGAEAQSCPQTRSTPPGTSPN